MHALKVCVENGRIRLDEPTDLPDGAEVEVMVIDDDFSAEERAELHASLDRALDDSETGRGMDRWEFLAQYRARRERGAQVKNGRLVLDEPTDLPEGQIVELVPVDDVLANGGDDLSDEERAALHASIEEGERELDAGQVIGEKELWARLRAIP